MTKPKPSILAEFRDTLDDLLRPYIQDEDKLVEVIMNIVLVSDRCYSDDLKPRKRGTLESMVVGMSRVETIKSRCYNRFHLNYPWHRKEGQEFIEFAVTRPENETIDKFADWYEKHDWRGQKRQPPTLQQIYELWPMAFTQPEEKIGIFRAEDDEGEQ